MEFLTVQDGLYLLARVRGVPFSRIQSVVTTISSLFLLDPFLHNYIHQLSGGTKRRLHAALALIGQSSRSPYLPLSPFSFPFQDHLWLPFSTSQRRALIPMLDSRCKRSFSMRSKQS